MTQYICIKNRQYYTEHKPKIGDVYLVLPPMKQDLQWNLYEKSDHHVSGLRYILGLPSDIFLEHFKPLDEYRQEQIDQLLSEPPFFQVEPTTFNPKKSILERYGSKETIREIKIDKLLK